MSEISEIRRLNDILSVHVNELTGRLGDNLQGIVLLGLPALHDICNNTYTSIRKL